MPDSEFLLLKTILAPLRRYWARNNEMCKVRVRDQTNLRNALLMHSSVQHRPGYSAGVLALEEEGLGLAILESEDLAVTADIEFAL